jgi:heme exporter protein C
MPPTTTSSTTDGGARRLAVLGVATATALSVAVVGLFLVAPEDTLTGEIQRIFYFHVAIAIGSMVAFGVACVCGALYLRRADQRWDDIGSISIAVGLLFSALTVITGSIWAKGAWGTWWRWDDPRLVTYLIVILLYAAYFVLRSSAEGERRERYSAVYAVFAFAAVPLSFYAVRVAESFIHPVVFTQNGADMPSSMLVWFALAQAGMIGLFATLVQLELLQRRSERALRDLKLRLEALPAARV